MSETHSESKSDRIDAKKLLELWVQDYIEKYLPHDDLIKNKKDLKFIDNYARAFLIEVQGLPTISQEDDKREAKMAENFMDMMKNFEEHFIKAYQNKDQLREVKKFKPKKKQIQLDQQNTINPQEQQKFKQLQQQLLLQNTSQSETFNQDYYRQRDFKQQYKDFWQQPLDNLTNHRVNTGTTDRFQVEQEKYPNNIMQGEMNQDFHANTRSYQTQANLIPFQQRTGHDLKPWQIRTNQQSQIMKAQGIRKQHLENYFDEKRLGFEQLQYKTFQSDKPKEFKNEFSEHMAFEKLGGIDSTLEKMKYDLMNNEMSNYDRNWTGINDRYRQQPMYQRLQLKQDFDHQKCSEMEKFGFRQQEKEINQQLTHMYRQKEKASDQLFSAINQSKNKRTKILKKLQRFAQRDQYICDH